MARSGIENVRPLALASVPCGVVVPPGDAAHYSRHAKRIFDWDWGQPMDHHGESVVDRLLHYGRSQPLPPMLAYCSDEPMLLVSRHRDQLAEVFRFTIPSAALVEALVDKTRFAELAAELDLPVPATTVLLPDQRVQDAPELSYPVMVKPRKRNKAWLAVDPGNGKALRVDGFAQLRQLWPSLVALGIPLVAQQYIEGPENRIESYHVYVDQSGDVAGEFTGRKIRTLPAHYGQTTSLAITDDAEVLSLGRKLVERLGLRGVAKFDFKRAPDGRLYLLEVNPRFNLWHHAGARAGVNLPALVYADLTGLPRPPVRAPDAITWCHPSDVFAARRDHVGLSRWLRFAMGSRAKASWSMTDPVPLLGGVVRRAATVLHRTASRPG